MVKNEEGGSIRKGLILRLSDCVGALQDKVFDYHDEALGQGYE